MSEIHTQLPSLRRPRVLVRAAKDAALRYDRSKYLNKLGAGSPATTEHGFLAWLIAEETALESARKTRQQAYDPAAHILTLSAVMAEISAARRAGPQLVAA